MGPPHWRQFSKSSLDRTHTEVPASPASISTHSTIKDEKRTRIERRCTVTVNEGYARDEVLLNFDVVGADVKPGMLMCISTVRDDLRKISTGHGAGSKQNQDTSKGASGTQNGDGVGFKYFFVAKDMPQETKTRNPDVEVYVLKHIADAFGMKKGCQVLLTMVRDLSRYEIHGTNINRGGCKEPSHGSISRRIVVQRPVPVQIRHLEDDRW